MDKVEKTSNKIHIEKFIKNLENTGRYSDDILSLIKSDLEYGLTEEQIKLYYKKKITVEKMRIYSKCLRNGYSQNVIDIITSENLSGQQMSIALEFYEKGVPIEDIKHVVDKDDTAMAMKKAYLNILENIQDTEKIVDESEYAKKLFSQIEEVVSKINYQERRYDKLNETLKMFEETKRYEEEIDKLLRENEDKENIINDQQDKIMQANVTLQKYQKELEEKSIELENIKYKVNKLESEVSSLKKEKSEMNFKSNEDIQTFSHPIYFETLSRKRNTGFISRLFHRKKSKQDIIKLIIKKELMPSQLMQIRSGMEKGLTEKQLKKLINSNVSAENMKEIIEIAVLENSMQKQKGTKKL